MKDFSRLARELAEISHRFYARGWVLGTSGNFSAVLSRSPLRLAITASGVAKGALTAANILQCGDDGRVMGGRRRRSARPSAETLLHVEIAKSRSAGAVLHTHSVWSTILSDLHARDGGLALDGYEMLKGLQGVASHAHREWIPIVENDQDMPRLARTIGDTLARFGDAHALLLRRHGVYTWGATLGEAERHVEILEFLFETVGRTREVTRGRHQHP